MPSFFTSLAVLHSGSAAPAGEPATSSARLSPVALAAAIAPDPVGLDLIARFPELGPLDLPAELELVFVGGGGMTARTALGDTTWTVVDAAGAQTIVDNGGLPTIDSRSLEVVGVDPVWTPVPAARFSGGMLAAVTADGATAVTGRASVQSRQAGSWSLAAAGNFVSADDDAGRAVLALNTYRAVTYRSGAAQPVQGNVGASGGPAFPPTTLAQDAVLLDCVWSGVAPWGAVYVDASDVGVSSTERTRIPPDVPSNAAANYLRYPAAFYRRPTFGRGVQLETPWADAITTGAGALTIYATPVDLAFSQWLFQLDGATFRVFIGHNGASGLRRPADIWNQVIVPAMNRDTPLELYELTGGGPVFVGYLSRLEFLEYACFIIAAGDDGEIPFELVAQTGGVAGGGPLPP